MEDASYIGVEELKEITALSGMKNPQIYKRILS
jgi:predicted DNA-binding transcriptional regulator AlpA